MLVGAQVMEGEGLWTVWRGIAPESRQQEYSVVLYGVVDRPYADERVKLQKRRETEKMKRRRR